MSATVEMPRADTLEYLLERLGNVPSSRVSTLAPVGGCSEEKYIELIEAGKGLFELVDGTLVEKTMGWFQNHVAIVLLSRILPFVRTRNLGIVLAETGPARIVGQIRMPDGAFYPWSRFPGGGPPQRGPILDAVPDLAVEVMSNSNTAGEMERKRREYFEGGTRLVWEIEPDLRLVRVYTNANTFTVVNEAGTLEGDPVLTGLRISVRDLFTFTDEQTAATPGV